jgi:hypothetical protein
VEQAREGASATRPQEFDPVKSLLAILTLTAAMMSSAHACAPPDIGDQFRYNDGRVIELAKPVDQDCYFEKRKACFRPVGSHEPCRWIKFPDFYEGPSGKWIVINGVKQD